MNKAKILLLDIETAPNKAFIWSLWQEPSTTDCVINEWFILCWCAKFLGSKEMLHGALYEEPGYKKDPENDKVIMEKLWKLLDEADVVVAHNGIKFDIKKINTRFVKLGIKPPSPFRVVDTLKVARHQFAFLSNRLNDLSKFLGLGEKMKTGGFKTWKQCLEGDEKAWGKMVKYCGKDVILLEKVYLKLRPFMKQHPNLAVLTDAEREVCHRCESSKIQYRGYAHTNQSKYRRFQCTECGAWGRSTKNEVTKSKRKVMTTNISH